MNITLQEFNDYFIEGEKYWFLNDENTFVYQGMLTSKKFEPTREDEMPRCELEFFDPFTKNIYVSGSLFNSIGSLKQRYFNWEDVRRKRKKITDFIISL